MRATPRRASRRSRLKCHWPPSKAAPKLEGPGQAQGGVARGCPVLVDAPALQIEGPAVQRERAGRRGIASPARGRQVTQTPAALAVAVVGAEGEVQVGALVERGVYLVQRAPIGQTVPVLPLAQIALVDDAETAMGADIAPGRGMQKEYLGRAVAVDASAAMLLARQTQGFAEIDLSQLQCAPAATVGATGVGGNEGATGPVGRRLAHPDAGQAARAGNALAIHGEHRARLAPTAPLLVAQHFRREARLGAPAGPPRAGRAEHQVRHALGPAHFLGAGRGGGGGCNRGSRGRDGASH